MRVPAISSPHTDRQSDTRLPALWSRLRSAQNTLPCVGTNHGVWGLVFFFLFVFILSFLLSLYLLPTSLSSLSKFSAVHCLSLPFWVCCQAGFQGRSFWPSAQGSADGHSPAGTARGSAPASVRFHWTMSPARAAKALSVEWMSLDLLEQDGPDSEWRR